MEIEKTSWLEDFSETCQAIREDSVLLEALAAYISCGGDVFPQTLVRLSDYLSQHAADLHCLEARLRPEG